MPGIPDEADNVSPEIPQDEGAEFCACNRERAKLNIAIK